MGNRQRVPDARLTFSVQVKMVTSDIKQKREGRSYKHLLQLVAINGGLI